MVLRTAYKTSYGRKDSLRRYLEIQTSYALVAREGTEIVGFGATIDYGPFAYIGLMAAHPKVQRRGAGGMILDEILAWLASRRCPTILLDASPAGVHLYEKHGFSHSDVTYSMSLVNAGRSASNQKIPNEKFLLKGDREKEFADLVTFDRPFFGADRGSLLRSYFEDDPRRFLVSRNASGRINGYLVAQDRVLGPWVVSEPQVAESLLSSALEFHFEHDPTVMVSASNSQCLELLRSHGFQMQRSLQHMYLGKQVERSRTTAIYGMATLGFG